MLEVGPDLRNRWKRRLTAAEKRFCATQMGVAHTVLDTVAEHWTRWAASINFYVDTMNHAEDQSSNEMAIRISRARNELCTALSREVTEVTSDTAMSLQTNLSYNQGSVRNTVHRAHSALYWFRKILTLVSEHQADLRFRLGLVGCSVSGLEPELKALESVIHLRWSRPGWLAGSQENTYRALVGPLTEARRKELLSRLGSKDHDWLCSPLEIDGNSILESLGESAITGKNEIQTERLRYRMATEHDLRLLFLDVQAIQHTKEKKESTQ